jgi:hypothetical protein
LIHDDSMAIVFNTLITFNAGEMFHFGSLSCIVDRKGVLHRIAGPFEEGSSPTTPAAKTGLAHPASAKTTPASFKARRPQPTSAARRIAPALDGPRTTTTSAARPTEEALPSRRTPLPTLPTRAWTRVTRRKKMGGANADKIAGTRPAVTSVAPLTWETAGVQNTAPSPFFPDVLFIQGRIEDAPISDDEPTVLGEEPPQRETRQRRNRRRNIWRHHEAGERDPSQPVSRDEASEAGETPEDRTLRERRNARRRDRRHAQERERERAEHDTRHHRENPPLPRNLLPDFARALNTPSEVGGVLAQIANGLLRTSDTEGYR